LAKARSVASEDAIFDAACSAPSLSPLLDHVEAGGALSCHGFAPAGRAFLAALLHRRFPKRPLLVVVPTLRDQETVHADLTTWLNLADHRDASDRAGDLRNTPRFYPPWEVLPHESKLPHSDVLSERLESLVALMDWNAAAGSGSDPAPVVVTSVTALLQRTFAATELRTRTRQVRKGDTVNPLDLIEWLEEQGYEPEAQVSSKGELSWRGGIVDLWPLSSPWPLRLEFFGDELESIREFDPHQQTSRGPVEHVVIPPAGELNLLRKRFAPATAITSDPASAESEASPAAPLATLLDHFRSDAVVLLCEPTELDAQVAKYEPQVPNGSPFHIAWTEWQSVLEVHGTSCLRLSELAGTYPDAETQTDLDSQHDLGLTSLDAFRPIGSTLPEMAVAERQRRDFFEQIQRWLRQKSTVHVFCNNDGERQRFGELWKEYGFDASPVGMPKLHIGALSRGFLLSNDGLVVVSDAEIYGRYKVSRPRRLKSRHAQSVRSAFEIDFSEFEEGDFVVHLQYGIGIFRGLKTLAPAQPRGVAAASVQGGGQESLVIEYAAGDSGGERPKLYVPVSQAHLVTKYVGAGKANPQLNTLGGTRWAKSKDQAQRAVQDLAAELLRVQAARSVQAGYAFSADTAWQREFEGAFEFEETQDQITAIAAAKRDMEAERPMDRLLCGDVGFGKTEVAIRAAFKAVMGGRQVALLVPTTVLAQQHYNTLRDRMAEFPVRVELLSRYRSAKQQRAVMEAAANGTVDIVVGTHRIVSPDVQFKQLGLVIIDEEQKFGVKHKEQFKILRSTIDVLTLSATPIPRTLYLALTGARDLSTLETPPQDRLPVETVVGNYDERVIRDAIQRELNRGGQTYFLHNRVSTIEAVAMKLRALVPEARIVVGHGQMDADDLERVMTQFVNGDADVLVSTTIIESGLDIPNANTILIDRADRFGLSDLYQLRGRVGRYKHQAYCYLMLPRHAQLLTEARKRMSAIKQYSALGSGFKIALRDLEIRGAGNLLGAQQSGHITAVGFDLYCQLLKQSVEAMKGGKVSARVDVKVSLDFLALNPGEEQSAAPADAAKPKRPKFQIEIPRDDGIATWHNDSDDAPKRRGQRDSNQTPVETRKEAAYLPLDYVREPAQRLELYRKLAQATTRAGLDALKAELRDRFGPPPPAVERMLGAAELRILASEKQISSLEVVDGKIKLTRGGDLITLNGQFPRLTKITAKDRLLELKKLLMMI
jgi:transcription-repair coupling factor (superfamily II helicase)